MRYFSSIASDRLGAVFIGGAFSVLLATASLAAPALAADQPTTTAQATDTIGPHTDQIHGFVKGTPAAGATTFTVTTERYGDVTVTFNGPKNARTHGHAQRRGRSFELASASALEDGDRIVVQGRTSADGKTFVARRVHVLSAASAAARLASWEQSRLYPRAMAIQR